MQSFQEFGNWGEGGGNSNQQRLQSLQSYTVIIDYRQGASILNKKRTFVKKEKWIKPFYKFSSMCTFT